MPNCLRWLVLVGVLTAPLQAAAQRWGEDSQMFIIQGIITDSERTAGELGYDSFSLSYSDEPKAKVRWLAIVGANTWNGDSFDAKNTLDDIVPPNLILDAKAPILKLIQDSPNGTKFRLEGMLMQDSGNFLLQSATIVPAKSKNTPQP